MHEVQVSLEGDQLLMPKVVKDEPDTFLVRMPSILLQRIRLLAKKESESITSWIVSALSAKVDADFKEVSYHLGIDWSHKVDQSGYVVMCQSGTGAMKVLSFGVVEGDKTVEELAAEVAERHGIKEINVYYEGTRAGNEQEA